MLLEDEQFLVEQELPPVPPGLKQQGSDNYSLPSDHTASSSSESNVVVAQGVIRSVSSEKRHKRQRKSTSNSNYSPQSITYRGLNFNTAAQQGNMPLCVLLWSMASAKRVNLVIPDSNGNTPMHFAAIADTPEVHFCHSFCLYLKDLTFFVCIFQVVQFLAQQTRGDEVRLVDVRNTAGETPLLRCMTTGIIPVAKVAFFKHLYYYCLICVPYADAVLD